MAISGQAKWDYETSAYQPKLVIRNELLERPLMTQSRRSITLPNWSSALPRGNG